MRALLVNPWVYDFKAFDFWNKPVGLLIVSNILKTLNFNIDYIDCMDRSSTYFVTNTKTDMWGRGKYNHEIIQKPSIFKKVPRYFKRYGIPKKVFQRLLQTIDKPDIIFVTSAMTYWYPGAFEAIRLLKNKFPNTQIILGGIYATLCEQHAKKYSGADFVYTGPSEKNLVTLLNNLGLSNRSALDTPHTIPDFSLYKKLNYGVILTSRGCPFACTYCATKILCDGFKVMPNNLIINQLDYFNRRTKNIAFFDDALLCNKQFVDILKRAEKKNYSLNFHTSNGLHCRYINGQIARLMLRANFKTMYLSLETTNPDVQKRTGNKVNTGEFIQAVKILTKVGFTPDSIHTYILFGMPGQDHEEIFDSIKLCHSLGVHPHLCEFSPIPHTQEYKKTGFDDTTDPLYHNNLFYTWYYPEPRSNLYSRIKRLLNKPMSH